MNWLTSAGDSLQNSDLNYMQTLGRYAARGRDELAVNKAAEYLSIATENEYNRLLWWFEEGVRNYADSQGEVNRLMQLVKGRACTK